MTRGLAGISGFLGKARAHVEGTGKDKYAVDRKHEPADVLTEWFPGEPFLWNAGKYLSRLPRTKKESDFFKAIHYIGMEYNRIFGKPEDPVPLATAVPSPMPQDGLYITASGEQFGRSWFLEKHTKDAPALLGWLMACLEIFEERHKRRGPSNINLIGFDGCLMHAKEKLVRAATAKEQMTANAEAARALGATVPKLQDDPVWQDLKDSLIDGAVYILIAAMLAEGTWPANPEPKTVQDTGAPV